MGWEGFDGEWVRKRAAWRWGKQDRTDFFLVSSFFFLSSAISHFLGRFTISMSLRVIWGTSGPRPVFRFLRARGQQVDIMEDGVLLYIYRICSLH
jgi:capsule polysaccharide export protein KpsC/LpsZ